MNKEKNKQFSIKFKPSLMEQVEKYIEVVNENKDPSEKKFNKATFFNNVVADFFKGKVLTNDFIKLEKPFYFDSNELFKKGVVKASVEVPIHNLDSCFIVKKVPNNLDEWNIENKSYSIEGSSSIHKGIFISYSLICSADEYEVTNIYESVKRLSEEFIVVKYYYIFKLDVEADELEISLVPFNELFLYVPFNSDVIASLEEEKEYFYNNILIDRFNINFDLLSEKNEVLESFYNKKASEKTLDMLKNFNIKLE